jgi:signal transduction histidine kinase
MARWLNRSAPSRSDPRSATVVVCGLVGFVTLVYAVIVLGGGLLIGQKSSPNVVLSIVATATVALAFESVQARLERLANRLLGVAGSPYEVLTRFTATTAADLVDDLPHRMATLLAEGTGAPAAQVWLMVDHQPVLAASWPASDADYPLGTVGTMHVTSSATWRSLPVREGDETLAVLSLQEREGTPLSPVEERLFVGLAAQAGLVLRSARLRTQLSARLVELSARATELDASRHRLIETQDAERRKLERDIHDGAQQNLVALAVNLRLADTLLGRSRERAAVILGQQSAAAEETIATLTRLSRGIYPVELAEQGLVPALEAVAAGSVVPVHLQSEPGLELSPEVQAALYFCCLEALQNAIKHAGETAVRISLGRSDDELCLVVSDDGAGYSESEVLPGAGTANMRDRIDAIGGTLRVTSRKGNGTRVEARVPAAVAAVSTS